ncbi:MAG TPA: hypothetical protein VGN51_22250 [Acidimicrobiia bacterium]|jgi:hypothetical protein
MGRISIDTEALHDLSGQLGNDARELGGLNLDLVRAWSHVLPPPASLVAIGAESGRIQARLGGQTSGLALDAVRLGAYATGVELQEGGRRLFGDLGAWGGQIRSESRSAWKRFRAWGSHVIPTVARDMVRASFGVLGLLPPFGGAADMVSKVVVATGVGIAALAWTTLLNEPASVTSSTTATVDSTKKLLEVADTLDGDQIAIVKLDDMHYVVVLRGVEPDKTTLYRTLAMSGVEESGHWGPYSDAVMRAITGVEPAIPQGATVSFAGHSLGGIVAVNVAGQLSKHGYQTGPVLTLGSPTTGEAAANPNITAIVNDPYGLTLDPVTKLDKEILVLRSTSPPPNVVVVHQPGGPFPHGLSTYEDALNGPGSPTDALANFSNGAHLAAGQQAEVTVYNLGP